jgi:hypothetical protein
MANTNDARLAGAVDLTIKALRSVSNFLKTVNSEAAGEAVAKVNEHAAEAEAILYGRKS